VVGQHVSNPTHSPYLALQSGRLVLIRCPVLIIAPVIFHSRTKTMQAPQSVRAKFWIRFLLTSLCCWIYWKTTIKRPDEVAPFTYEVMTWKAFSTIIGCKNDIPAPEFSLQPMVSNILKLHGCQVKNMEAPPFFNPSSPVRNKVVIDVGANNGEDYSRTAAFVKGHTVYAFEPIKETQLTFIEEMNKAGVPLTVVDVTPGQPVVLPKPALKRTRTKGVQGHVTLIRAAAGAATTSMAVPLSKSTVMNSLVSSNAALSGELKQVTETIAVVTLDDVLEEYLHKQEHIFLLKIDTQGYEPSVFQGAKKVDQIRTCRSNYNGILAQGNNQWKS